MEQLLTTFGINWKLLVIQGVNFTVLLVALTYFLYKPLMKMLDERRSTIAKGIADAHDAAHKLSSAEVEKNALLAKAGTEAEGIVLHARTTAEQKASAIVTGAEAKAEVLLAEAQAKGAESARRAMAESEKEIARAAVLAAEKILAKKA